MDRITWITPSLAIWDGYGSNNAASEAAWISKGNTSYVNSEETAVDVLRALGLSDAEIEDRLHFAKTGQVA